MPYSRRVIFSTYVIPTQSLELEEDSVRKTTFQVSPNGTLGGKGEATIDAIQWNDGWTSMFHSNSNWEDFDDSDDTTGNRWEDTYDLWSGVFSLTTLGKQLTLDTTDCGFLYIKNIGSAKNALVSLNSDGNYYIIIPPGGSVCLRGTTDLQCSEVYVKASHSDGTDIEYIIAQLTP